MNWRKSTYSSNNGSECLEVADNIPGTDTIPIRDSKRPQGATLTIPTPSWTHFLTTIQAGEPPHTH
ncbi:DUF397 domain-containing protein [Streptomyces orinoci]|uniref:DUF397 domain-containing protein n=1 Tax=Streptomyces orinoci TaxID=67339 RepID=A0ABV3K7Q5_STRON|nr:DUF397 domain-containing protein [Streptomyces orinoci]